MAAFVNFVGYPAGATVFIDDKEVGTTPLYYYMLKWGKYRIVVEKEGYEPEIREEFSIWKTDRKKTMVYHLNKKEVMETASSEVEAQGE